MNREGHESITFFFGREVEKTPAFNLMTLFVVGTPTVDEIDHALASATYDTKHIFFGANHSFDPQTPEDWDTWVEMITVFLDRGYLCSLDISLNCAELFVETPLVEYNNFIPQIRVPVPYVKLWNYNTMIKIDDKDFAATNPGVWTHSLHDLMSRDTFTDWSKYQDDQVLGAHDDSE